MSRPTPRWAGLRRLYRLGLRLYPPGFRAQFGDEMTQVFADQLAAAGAAGALAVCARELGGLVRQAAHERLWAAPTGRAQLAQTSGGPRLFRLARPSPEFWRGLLAAAVLVGVGLLLAPTIIGFIWSRVEQTPKVNQVALADFNGDGRLDAFLATGRGNLPYATYVLYNDGAGRLGATARNLKGWPGFAAAAGDLNGDGRADALLDISGGGIFHFRNGAAGLQLLGALAEPGPVGVMRLRPVLGDLNGDGRLDVFAAGCCGREAWAAVEDEALKPLQLPYSRSWLQTEAGGLAPGPHLGQQGSNGAALADLNGDGSLDVFLANGSTLNAAAEWVTTTPNTVWFNDGLGGFTDSGQLLGQSESTAVALGDLNADGWADAVVGNAGPAEVWVNDGRGFFTDSGQRLASGASEAVFLADLDNDGDLDLLTATERQAVIWLNDGRGEFEAGGQRLNYSADTAVAVGDLDGDGWTDVLLADGRASRVWRNDGRGRLRAEPWVRYR